MDALNAQQLQYKTCLTEALFKLDSPAASAKKRRPKGRLFNFGLGWVSPSLFSQLRRRNLPPLSQCPRPPQGEQTL